jgi:hypothetical protein
MAMPRFDGGTSFTTSPAIDLAGGDPPARRWSAAGRLAAARRADEDDELARLYVEVDAMENVQIAVGFPHLS